MIFRSLSQLSSHLIVVLVSGFLVNGAVLVQMDDTLLGKFIASKLSLMMLTQLIS